MVVKGNRSGNVLTFYPVPDFGRPWFVNNGLFGLLSIYKLIPYEQGISEK